MEFEGGEGREIESHFQLREWDECLNGFHDGQKMAPQYDLGCQYRDCSEDVLAHCSWTASTVYFNRGIDRGVKALSLFSHIIEP